MRKAMKHKNPVVILLAAAIMTMAASCTTKPVHDYAYANLNRFYGWKGNTVVTLNFDMTDTTGACELYIIGEVATQRSSSRKQALPINIILTAPGGKQYTDSVSLPLHVIEDGKRGKTSHGVREIVWPYRKNIYNRIPGRWSITFSKGDSTEDYSNILGLGIHCKQKKQ